MEKYYSLTAAAITLLGLLMSTSFANSGMVVLVAKTIWMGQESNVWSWQEASG